METYTQRLPKNADLTRRLWYKPKPHPDTEVWYWGIPIGERTLGTFVKDMMTEAGLHVSVGNFTNHSLRVSTVNRLRDEGCSDGDIMKLTGHRSSTTMASYRGVSEVNGEKASVAFGSSLTAPADNDMRDVQEVLSAIKADEWNLDLKEDKTGPSNFNSVATLTNRSQSCTTDSSDTFATRSKDAGTQTDISIPPKAEVTITLVYSA